MIVPDRLRERIEAAGLSQSELARRVSVTQGAIAGLLSGRATGSKHLHSIANVLGTTPAYLEGRAHDPSAGALPAPTPETVAEQLDLVMVHEVDLQYGFGASFVDSEIESQPIAFPRTWLEMFTHSPAASLFFARGRGDSMMPTLLDGDIVLVDRAQNRIGEQDLIWALAYGDMASIKRVRRTPAGQFRVMSDNDRVPDEIMTADELHVVGRVVWVGRKM